MVSPIAANKPGRGASHAPGTTVHLNLDGGAALSPELIAKLNDACDQIEDADPGALLLIHIKGKVESGALHAWPGSTTVHWVSKWERALRRVERLGAASIVGAESACNGLALELLLAGDLCIGATGLRIHMDRQSIWPGMWLHRAAIQFGLRAALEWTLFDGEISSARCADLKLVHEVTDDVSWRMATIASSMGPAASAAVALNRRLMLESVHMSYETALGIHLAACDLMLKRIQSSAG